MTGLPKTTEIRYVSVDAPTLTVAWDHGSPSTFDSAWLRHHCTCAACAPRPPAVPPPNGGAPARTYIEDGALHVIWPQDGHRSVYEASWLRAHAGAPAAAGAESPARAHTHRPAATGGEPPAPDRSRPPKVLWDGRLSAPPSVAWDGLGAGDGPRHRLETELAAFGFVVVRGLGTDHDTLREQADALAASRHPGGITAYHCLAATPVRGGEVHLVDSHFAASLLRDRHPAHFDVLTTVPLPRERRVTGQVVTVDAPAVALDRHGEITDVHVDEVTPPARESGTATADRVQAALRAFFRLAHDPAHRLTHHVRPGEALLADNSRTLHAWAGFPGDWHLRRRVFPR